MSGRHVKPTEIPPLRPSIAGITILATATLTLTGTIARYII